MGKKKRCKTFGLYGLYPFWFDGLYPSPSLVFYIPEDWKRL